MSASRIRLSYYSRKMLQTLDLNAAVQVLMDKFGDAFAIEFEPMSDEERHDAEGDSAQITLVLHRFMLKQLMANGAVVRREDLEKEIVAAGRK